MNKCVICNDNMFIGETPCPACNVQDGSDEEMERNKVVGYDLIKGEEVDKR
jgi:hypothetical protein